MQNRKVSQRLIGVLLCVALTSVRSVSPAEPDAATKATLDVAQRLAWNQQLGDPQSVEYWRGFEEDTSITYLDIAESQNRRVESRTQYVLVRRSGEDLTIKETSGDQSKTYSNLTVAPPTYDGQSSQRPVDEELASEKTITIAESEYTCDLSQRTTRSIPKSGPAEIILKVRRVQIWRCARAAVPGGLLKSIVTWEEDRGKGLQVKRSIEMNVTNLKTRKLVDGAVLDCHCVRFQTREDGVLVEETTQDRSEMVPGGIVESCRRRRLDPEGKSWEIFRRTAERIRLKPMSSSK